MKKTVLFFLIISLIFFLFSCKPKESVKLPADERHETVDSICKNLVEMGFENSPLGKSEDYFRTYISRLDKSGEIFTEEELSGGYAYLYLKEGEASVNILVFNTVVLAKRYRAEYLEAYPFSSYALKRSGAVIIVGNKEAVEALTL